MTLALPGCEAAALLPEGPARTVLYAPGLEHAAELWAALRARDAALVALGGVNWNADLSPWPARRAFRGGEDFAGGAGAYLQRLTGELIPAAEAALGLRPERRGLVGYSLAGLFALYALYRTPMFALVGCVSGSLWYDGFAEWMRSGAPQCAGARVYLSLGDREAAARDPRLACVQARAEEAAALLASQGAESVFELNPGNHFADMPARMARGVDWLLAPENR